MKQNVKTMLIVLACLFGFSTATHSAETMGEKAKAGAKAAKHAVKKGAHRAEEALCGKLTGDSKVECLAKKGKHRMEEGADAVKNKASEVKEAIDTDDATDE